MWLLLDSIYISPHKRIYNNNNNNNNNNKRKPYSATLPLSSLLLSLSLSLSLSLGALMVTPSTIPVRTHSTHALVLFWLCKITPMNVRVYLDEMRERYNAGYDWIDI